MPKESDFILDLGGRKIPMEQLRLDNFDREILHSILKCFEKSMDWPEVREFHNESLNLFMTSLVVMLTKIEFDGIMNSSIQDGKLTIKVKVVQVEKVEPRIKQHRAFKCTSESVRIDGHDRQIVENMINCMNDNVAKKEEVKYFISAFHHRTLKIFFNKLYKAFYEFGDLWHFNNCVDKEGNLYVSIPYAGK
jgi:hypothetical protein